MTRETGRYLRYSSWPAADKTLWQAAFSPGSDLFDEAGAGAHLAERTIWQLRYTYGRFLFFITTKHPDLLKRGGAERVSPAIIEEFVKSQPVRCGSVTISVYLQHLWLAVKYLHPGQNWTWLLAISNRIKARAKTKPKRYHSITSETLYLLGIKLMDDALASGRPATSWRMQTAFRDGLIIALLALIPLRRRTLAALRIGKQLLKSGKQWVLEIPAADVKTKRPLDFLLSTELSKRIDIYVGKIRPNTAGATTHDYLWASSRGRALGGQIIYNAVCRRTRKGLGFAVNLHRFRHAAATLWSVCDPANVRGVKDLLGDSSFAVVEGHYIMSQSRVAGRALATAIENALRGEGR